MARTERREAGCGDGDDIRACCSRYGEEGKAEAAMGMAPALAAGGPVQRRTGVRAGRAEAAAMEEEQAVWIRRSPGTEECFR